MMFLLLVCISFADPPATVFVEEGKIVNASGPSFVVHEERMDILLAKAKSAEDFKTELVKVTDSLERLNLELSVILDEREEDSMTILNGEIALIAAKQERKYAIRQRNIAYAVTLSTLGGGITAAYIATRL